MSWTKGHRQAPNGRVGYVVIPSFLLLEWANCNPNLVIFDLQAHGERNAKLESISGSLRVCPGEIPGLLKWLPPKSTVVLSDGSVIERFDPQSESILLRLGIDVIYFLDRSIAFPLTVSSHAEMPK